MSELLCLNTQFGILARFGKQTLWIYWGNYCEVVDAELITQQEVLHNPIIVGNGKKKNENWTNRVDKKVKL